MWPFKICGKKSFPQIQNLSKMGIIPPSPSAFYFNCFGPLPWLDIVPAQTWVWDVAGVAPGGGQGELQGVTAHLPHHQQQQQRQHQAVPHAYNWYEIDRIYLIKLEWNGSIYIYPSNYPHNALKKNQHILSRRDGGSTPPPLETQQVDFLVSLLVWTLNSYWGLS